MMIKTPKRNYIKKKKSTSNKKYFECGGNLLNGIIKYSADKTGSNIHQNGTINITASSSQRYSWQ